MNKAIKNFLIDWNKFPIDYWWRHKHNVAFNSTAHREMSWIDMAIEYREDIEITKELEGRDREEEEMQERYFGIGKKGENVVKMTQAEIDEDYDNLDLSKFSKDGDN